MCELMHVLGTDHLDSLSDTYFPLDTRPKLTSSETPVSNEVLSMALTRCIGVPVQIPHANGTSQSDKGLPKCNKRTFHRHSKHVRFSVPVKPAQTRWPGDEGRCPGGNEASRDAGAMLPQHHGFGRVYPVASDTVYIQIAHHAQLLLLE